MVNFLKKIQKMQKKTWKQINTIVNKTKYNNPIACIESNNSQYETNPLKIGNVINEYYSTIAQKLVDKIKTDKTFEEFLDKPNENSFFMAPTNKNEIEKIINSLDSNKASDIYGLSVNVLKILSPHISQKLGDIFNESLNTGIFPDQMKLAMICPFHKGGSKLKPSNYRPVSILPILSKVFEKIMQSRLVKFLEQEKNIFPQQYGFQKNKSTTLAVLDLYSKIIQALDKGEYACSVFLDFAKAFDTVNHKILLKKLENYGIRGIANKWFESYLTNRYQTVRIGDTFYLKKNLSLVEYHKEVYLDLFSFYYT